jgi:hypothetical protein
MLGEATNCLVFLKPEIRTGQVLAAKRRNRYTQQWDESRLSRELRNNEPRLTDSGAG